MTENKIGLYKKLMGSVCHHCPFCKYGRKNPESTIGKILHSKIHADHCPMWRTEKEIYGENEK